MGYRRRDTEDGIPKTGNRGRETEFMCWVLRGAIVAELRAVIVDKVEAIVVFKIGASFYQI